MNTQFKAKTFYPILFGFFVMGFVDIVGIATNYVKKDFELSDTYANLLPMMVFAWFAIFSIPTGILMGKIGKKLTVIMALATTTVAMIVPFTRFYNIRYQQYYTASIIKPDDCKCCFCQ